MSVRKDYEALFAHLQPPEPPAGLAGRIVERITVERHLRAARLRLIAFGCLLTGVAAAVIPVVRSVQSSVAGAGLPQFTSLLFSDFGAVLSYWDSFLLALLEALPATGIATILALLLVSARFIKAVIRDVTVLRGPVYVNYAAASRRVSP